MEMFTWMEYILSNDSTKVIYVLTLITIASTLDFLLGWLNAKFNVTVKFSSNKAIYGIARKIIMIMLLVFFIPVSMLIPQPIGIGALWVLYLGYLFSEITSILNHLNLADDDKRGDLFADFVNKIFNGGNKK